MLQDIHCGRGKENIFHNAWGTDILISSYTNNARGVAILTKGINVKFGEIKVDEGGNFIIANVAINDVLKVVLVNIYGPNDDSPNFYEQIGQICEEIGEENAPVIIAGDFNIAMSGDVDTANYVRENNTRARDALVKLMEANSWVYIFRERNGDTRRYTWRNTSIGAIIKQARLDYFLISRSLIPFVSDENILPGYRTDHSMVTLKLDVQKQSKGKGFFKVNNALLQCIEFSEKIKSTILDTLLTYALPVYTEEFIRRKPNEVQINISWSSFWETLILNMRTATISYAIHNSRCRNLEERNTINEIEKLERVVQSKPSQEMVTNLDIAKEKLEQIRKYKL